MLTSHLAKIIFHFICSLFAATTMLIAVVLSGCASDDFSAQSIGATRPECLVNGSPISTARDTGMSARERECGSRQGFKDQ